MKSDNKSSNIKKSEVFVRSTNDSTENEAKYLILESAGYPFNFALLEGPHLEISDKVLFEQYAIEQWNGTLVKTGSYLFDQKIIPDYAFKVLKVFPENSIISENTSIVVADDSKERSRKCKK